MVTSINDNKMYKYDYIKVHSAYELKCALEYIDAKFYKLVTTATLGDAIYVYYKKIK